MDDRKPNSLGLGDKDGLKIMGLKILQGYKIYVATYQSYKWTNNEACPLKVCCT